MMQVVEDFVAIFAVVAFIFVIHKPFILPCEELISNK